MTNRQNLTDLRAKNFICPQGKGQSFLFSTGYKKLAVRTTANGKPSYVYQSRFNGKSIRITIGRVESWVLSDAMEFAKALQRAVDCGIDPRKARVVLPPVLLMCDVCFVVGGKAKVRTRSDVFGWNLQGRMDYATAPKNTLCTGCWNKAKAVLKREREADQIKQLVNKLNRTIKNGKNQNIRAAT